MVVWELLLFWSWFPGGRQEFQLYCLHNALDSQVDVLMSHVLLSWPRADVLNIIMLFHWNVSLQSVIGDKYLNDRNWEVCEVHVCVQQTQCVSVFMLISKDKNKFRKWLYCKNSVTIVFQLLLTRQWLRKRLILNVSSNRGWFLSQDDEGPTKKVLLYLLYVVHMLWLTLYVWAWSHLFLVHVFLSHVSQRDPINDVLSSLVKPWDINCFPEA